QESKFDGEARTPYRWTLGVIPMGRISSAYGYSQALDGTWEEYQKDQSKFRSRRNDIRDATDFMGWYMAQSKETLGIPLSDARNQYLAYHEGRTGFRRGSYRSKPWLMRVSGEVDQRAELYRMQLQSC
ncbi:MAG: lytic transglycosylase, partial [Pseudomonadota bacterium]